MNKEDTFQYNGSGPFCMFRGRRGGVRSACRRAVISARVCGAIARLCLTNGEQIRYNSAEKIFRL